MTRLTHRTLLAVALSFAATSFAMSAATAQSAAPAPEAATGRTVKQLGFARSYMVAAANPLAAEAGRQMLRMGGSAVDAAVAVQMVLNLVEPQSSGIGGGAFIVHYDAAAGTLTTLDGRETAPAQATPERFIGTDGKPMKFMDAVIGGRSVGVPGTLKAMETAHRRWGRLPWAIVLEPAMSLAENGFAISPRLNGLLAEDKDLPKDARARALFYTPDGSAKSAGTVLRNPAFAATLRVIAYQGSDAFYNGPIADDIVATLRSHPNAGDMTLGDLAAYRVEEREPLCGSYRGYKVCGMGPPSSGTSTLLQILAFIEPFDIGKMGPSPDALHLFSEAGRLAYADRGLYLGDPAFVTVPIAGLLDKGYLADRARLIDPVKTMGKAKPGEPPMKKAWLHSAGEAVERGTSHVSIIDGAGNAISMTTTIEGGFGAHLMTRSGFLLNNELTDFNFEPNADGKPTANRVEPGKRPRSSMAPTIIFTPEGRLHAVVGSPGGSLIINYVAKTIMALIDWKMDPQRAVDFPNMGSRNGATEIEKGTEIEAWADALKAKGHAVSVIEQTSGTQAILVTPRGYDGGADFRREGVAIGD